MVSSIDFKDKFDINQFNKIFDKYTEGIDLINEKTKTLPSISETASAKLDAIIAKFKEFGEKAKTANKNTIFLLIFLIFVFLVFVNL